jgi:hydroxyacylglutathione hydrolase
MPIQFETIVNGPFEENCFLVWDDAVMAGILIDPGSEPDLILGRAEARGVKLDGIFNTHGHLDHTGAVAAIVKRLGIPFALHPADRPLVATLPTQARMFGLPGVASPEVDCDIVPGESIAIGGCRADVLYTPGHTPGGVSFVIDDLAFVGDTLFMGSIGRTDLPGGDHRELIRSIVEQLFPLGDDTRVLTGHGPATNIGFERAHNPFLQT